MSHYCRICERSRANERFSGRGHRDHVCKECKRLPKETRRAKEEADELAGHLRQSRISEKNLARLGELAKSKNVRTARWARIVLEVGRVTPYKRRRIGILAREHPALLREIDAASLLPLRW